jgi:hypothetical protein
MVGVITASLPGLFLHIVKSDIPDMWYGNNINHTLKDIWC